MANKITKKEMFNAIKAVLQREDVEIDGAIAKSDMVDALDHEVELLEKKALNKKATKNQEQNEVLKDEILNVLTDVGATITDIQAKSDVLAPLNNQKITALLRQLKERGKVVKTYDKKKAYFALASDEVEE